ncbi:MAG: LuxR C-terminal-related transcriptional regulator [Caldilineaceae bacterium]
MTAGTSLSPRRVKLRPPRLPEDLVARPRLLARLNRMAALSLIVAPAGYGKTTLVGMWLAQTDLPYAWLSLDEGDNDPALFLAGLAGALAAISPGFGVDILEGINSPHTTTFADLAVLLINQLNELSDDFILVLDDYHAIHDPVIHQLLIGLATYPPRAMHLVITTRYDPPLPWRVRTRSSLCELRAADLRFTEQEAAEFLAKVSDHPVAGIDTCALVEQSQGWVTSLRLTALAMRIQGADGRWSNMTNASFRDFGEYFGTELLAGLAPHTMAFLLRTSILDPLCGPLCDYVLAGAHGGAEFHEDSAVLLRTLERTGAFTVALDDDGTWYRYHPLLREVLRRRLEDETPKIEIAALYRRASTWLEEHNLYDEALAYALNSGEIAYAVAFLQRRRPQLLDNLEWRRVERWLQQFPPPTIERYVELLLTRAWINQWRYNVPEVQADLDCIEAMLAGFAPDEPRLGVWHGEVAALRSQQSLANGDADGAVAAAHLALTTLPPGQFYSRTIAIVHLALACQMLGQWELARTVIDNSVGQHGIPRDMALARVITLRAYINLPATNLLETRTDVPTLLQILTARGIKTSAAWAHHFWACVSYLQNDLHSAAEHFGAVLELVDHAHTLAYAHSAIGLALVYQAQGFAQEAKGVVEGAKRTLAARQQAYALQLVGAFAADLAARQGRIEEALRWVAREGRHFTYDFLPMFYVPGLAFVRILLTSATPGNQHAAETWLEKQTEYAVRMHNNHAQIQCYVLAAALRESLGDRKDALAALQRALALAEQGQDVRVFVDLAAELAPLFDALAADQPLWGFAARVHGALRIDGQPPSMGRQGPTAEQFAAEIQDGGEDDVTVRMPDDGKATGQEVGQTAGERDLRELLTYRETDVLRLLEQRLTNKEIAHLLGISTETVRQHTVNLFRKLNVGNRRQAIVVARSRGYFEEQQ